MKNTIDRQRARFYAKTGLAYLGLWLFVDLLAHRDVFPQYWLNEIWRAIYIIPVIYFFFEHIFQQITPKPRRIARTAFLLLSFFLVSSILLYTWRELGMQLRIHTAFITYSSHAHGIADQFGAMLFAVFFFGTIRHIHHFRELKVAAQQLRIEKQEAELNYLKSQTNPHFLFNTLNNIYSLARDKSSLAPESIMRLSKILRFMLYETGGEYITIEQELKIIADYIELEKLRYDDSLRINFKQDVADLKQPVPPLLLMPLVENAFKHGVSETRDQPFVDIYLSLSRKQLAFFIKNSADEFPVEWSTKEKIGLANLRRQLELLYTDFELSIERGHCIFTVSLKINLASHV